MEWKQVNTLRSHKIAGEVFLAYVPHKDDPTIGYAFVASLNTIGRIICIMSLDDYTDTVVLWAEFSLPSPQRRFEGDGEPRGAALDCTPDMALQNALIANRCTPADKALIVLYNDEQRFLVRYYNSGLTSIEGIGLLDIVQGMFREEMNKQFDT
jgi:hypothetical protein